MMLVSMSIVPPALYLVLFLATHVEHRVALQHENELFSIRFHTNVNRENFIFISFLHLPCAENLVLRI